VLRGHQLNHSHCGSPCPPSPDPSSKICKACMFCKARVWVRVRVNFYRIFLLYYWKKMIILIKYKKAKNKSNSQDLNPREIREY
jgi:hypothetical protein